MILVEALKDQLETTFPKFAERVNNLPETAFIIEVSKAFGATIRFNPSDWAVDIMGLIKDGKSPNEGGGAGSGQAEASVSRGSGH